MIMGVVCNILVLVLVVVIENEEEEENEEEWLRSAVINYRWVSRRKPICVLW
jgi:hypothetical protein